MVSQVRRARRRESPIQPGCLLRRGRGVAKDLAEAGKVVSQGAAEQGLAQAQRDLGVCYFLGDGVTTYLAEAVKWYRKAAEQGHVEVNSLGFVMTKAMELTQI